MKKVILIQYGELTTKKQNRNLFIQTLQNNINNSLKEENIKIIIKYCPWNCNDTFSKYFWRKYWTSYTI